MSLFLLATNLLDRLRARVPQEQPTAAPKPETPGRERSRLRQEVIARGGVLEQIETIRGDCPAQTDQQIRDLKRWLEVR